MTLTEDDIELVILQCEHQQDTAPEAIAAFTAAYLEAKTISINELIRGPDIIQDKVIEWAKLIKPKENQYGYRTIPVVAGFNATLKPQLVPRAMIGWCEAYWWTLFKESKSISTSNAIPSPPLSADILYKQFEEIHPFRDGNGRVGHLLWAIAIRELEGNWPLALPPDLWRNE